MRSLFSAVAAGALLSASLAARADTIVHTFTFNPLAGFNVTEQGPSFAQFDPSTGTLNSVSLMYNAHAVFSGGDNTNSAFYAITLSTSPTMNVTEDTNNSFGGGNSTFSESILPLSFSSGLA